jgi:hypothetical protein
MILRLFLMFGAGFLTWCLVFLRSISFREQRTILLSGVIFLDELAGIFIGMWLARNGTLYEAIACALGGTMAATISVRVVKWRQRVRLG